MVVISLSLLLKSPKGYLLACCAAGFICGSRPLNGTFISFVEKSDGATTFLKSDYRFSIGFWSVRNLFTAAFTYSVVIGLCFGLSDIGLLTLLSLAWRLTSGSSVFYADKTLFLSIIRSNSSAPNTELCSFAFLARLAFDESYRGFFSLSYELVNCDSGGIAASNASMIFCSTFKKWWCWRPDSWARSVDQIG